MPADDFDVELEKAEQQVKKPTVAAQQPRPQPAEGQRRETARGSAGEGQQQRPPVQAMSARRPGVLGRAAEGLTQAVGRIHLPRLDAVTILYGLLALIVFALLAENWSPVRINLFGVYIDVPKAVAFVVNLALGMLLLWLLQRHWRRGGAKAEGGRR